MKTTRWKFLVYALLLAATVMLFSALAFLSYPDFVVNTFLKGRITGAFQEAYPAYTIHIGDMHYSLAENRLGFDSVALTARDSTLSCTIDTYSASGIGWLQLLWARGLVPDGFTSTVLDAQGIVLSFPKDLYELRCKELQISVPDSDVVIQELTFHPSGDDEQFFAESKFRKTRFRIDIPHAAVRGVAGLELVQGKMYRARSADIRDVFVDVLINKDKSAASDTSRPLMPHEIFTLMEQTIALDSVNMWNASLKYAERSAGNSIPGVITLDNMQVSVTGIANHSDTNTVAAIRAKGQFMKSTDMTLLLSIPLSAPEFSLRYSGSVGRMDLRALNSFIESAEQVRIKAGVLHAATFDIRVAAGRASGNVRAVYNDLTLAAIDKQTGSDKGVLDGIASFIANTFTIRGTNMPDTSGSTTIGNVNYTRQRDDPFFGFAWFALRSGVGDVVGF